MTPDLLLLNSLSLAVICVLAVFAVHNKRSGWVKTRTTFVDDLRALREAWAEEDAHIVTARPLATAAAWPMPIAPIASAAFTADLCSLQTVLKQSAPQVETSQAIAETQEAVHQ